MSFKFAKGDTVKVLPRYSHPGHPEIKCAGMTGKVKDNSHVPYVAFNKKVVGCWATNTIAIDEVYLILVRQSED